MWHPLTLQDVAAKLCSSNCQPGAGPALEEQNTKPGLLLLMIGLLLLMIYVETAAGVPNFTVFNSTWMYHRKTITATATFQSPQTTSSPGFSWLWLAFSGKACAEIISSLCFILERLKEAILKVLAAGAAGGRDLSASFHVNFQTFSCISKKCTYWWTWHAIYRH